MRKFRSVFGEKLKATSYQGKRTSKHDKKAIHWFRIKILPGYWILMNVDNDESPSDCRKRVLTCQK